MCSSRPGPWELTWNATPRPADRILQSWRNLLCLGALALFPAALCADVVRLKDGTTLEGDIRKTDDGWVVTVASGRETTITADKVRSIEARPKSSGEGVEGRLASLRRAMENEPDLKKILDRYKVFIDQYPGTPAAEKAKADVELWKDRFARHLVKVGDKWVTPEEKRAALEKSYAVAEEAMTLVSESRLNEAMPVLDKALADNPQNGAAWYVRGVVLFRQDKIADARKAFEQSAALNPDHAPSFNNLAVILWRQNAQTGALNNYDRALLAAPGDRRVLDNLAEALNALAPEKRNDAVVKRIVRHFNDLDVALQQKLKGQGLFRWGSTWVSAVELAKLQAAEKEIQNTLDQMSADFDSISDRIKQIDVDLDTCKRTIKRMEIESVAQGPDGRIVHYAYPPSYYEYVRNANALQAERTARVTEQDRLRRQVKTVQQRMPTQKYTGAQHLIDVEGTPVPHPAGAPAAPPALAAPPAGAGALPPAAPPPLPAPATAPSTAPAPATRPARPTGIFPANPPTDVGGLPRPATRPVIPPERPSILDRRFDEPLPAPPGFGG